MPSAFSTSGCTSATGPPNTHLPALLQPPQPTQPPTGAEPMWKIVVSMPASFSTLAISVRAALVQPFLCGLPLINNTFIVSTSVLDLLLLPL